MIKETSNPPCEEGKHSFRPIDMDEENGRWRCSFCGEIRRNSPPDTEKAHTYPGAGAHRTYVECPECKDGLRRHDGKHCKRCNGTGKLPI